MTQYARTVEAVYAAFGRGDIASILGALREDVEWEHDAVDHGIPWLAPRQGRAQVAAFFDALRALDFRRFEPRRILADDTMAAAIIHVELAVRATGRVINNVELHLWTSDAQGKVARFRHVADTHQHWLASRG
ncbi:MAG TPA: nuclear transport factor 2 family protein [Dongiaceae bacterium]|nr:nuclear transport factor 2 family protein [Dongiaceae bacterium]